MPWGAIDPLRVALNETQEPAEDPWRSELDLGLLEPIQEWERALLEQTGRLLVVVVQARGRTGGPNQDRGAPGRVCASDRAGITPREKPE